MRRQSKVESFGGSPVCQPAGVVEKPVLKIYIFVGMEEVLKRYGRRIKCNLCDESND